MDNILIMAILWGLFGAIHIGLTTQVARARAVEAVGEGGFTVRFSLISAIAFAVLVVFFSTHRNEGPPGIALAQFAVARPILIGLIGAGLALLAASLVAYSKSPMALATHDFQPPFGLARITRHGFFLGLSLFAIAHMLLATRLIGTVFFAGFAAVSILGALHQDRKLAARYGRPYDAYLETTSFVPFAAIFAKRQYLAWRELPWLGFAIGIAITIGLRSVHGSILGYGGAYFIAATVGGAGMELMKYFLRRRSRIQPVTAP